MATKMRIQPVCQNTLPRARHGSGFSLVWVRKLSNPAPYTHAYEQTT